MPYRIIDLGGGYCKVVNAETGKVKAARTTRKKAKAMLRLLHAVEHNPEFRVGKVK